MRPSINSEKHIVQIPLSEIVAGNVSNNVLLTATQNPTARTEVRVGATVKAIFVEIWIIAQGNATGSITATIEKSVSGLANIDFGSMAQLHGYDNKKNIFYTTQGLTSQDAAGSPTPFLRAWVKIPKGKQRMGQGDRLLLNISANLANEQICGLAIYKEYY